MEVPFVPLALELTNPTRRTVSKRIERSGTTLFSLGSWRRSPGEYLSKGSNVYVEGSLKTEKWEDRDGNKKQVTKVIGSKLIMLGDRKKKEGREPGDEDDASF